jgi:hypothetical protein
MLFGIVQYQKQRFATPSCNKWRPCVAACYLVAPRHERLDALGDLLDGVQERVHAPVHDPSVMAPLHHETARLAPRNLYILLHQSHGLTKKFFNGRKEQRKD